MTSFWEGEGIAPDPSGQEKELRDRFVEEYLFDYSATAAATRVGYSKSFAETYGYKFLEEPYVKRLIKERQKAIAEDSKAEDEAQRRQVRAMLFREANYRGPGASHAARVAAQAKLMSLLDMDAPTKVKVAATRGGVMVVPGVSKVEDWEAEASASQDQLQKDSVVGPTQVH